MALTPYQLKTARQNDAGATIARLLDPQPIPIPRRSCTGARPEPSRHGYDPETLDVMKRLPPPDYGGIAVFWLPVCRCGRALEWGGQRWGCGACE